MNKLIPALLGLVVFTTAASMTFPDDRISNVIKEMAPHLDDKTAQGYARIIRKYSDKYGVDWKVAVAILKQESDFVMGEIDTEYRDFGIGQLNYRTIKAHGVDLGMLLTDEDYAIEQTFKILAELKKKYYTANDKGPKNWFTRYHSYTWERRKIYWHGRKKSGHDGLAYRLATIDRILTDGRQPAAPNTSSGLGNPTRTGTGRTESTNQEQVSCRAKACPTRRGVRGSPAHDQVLGEPGELGVSQGGVPKDRTDLDGILTGPASR